MKANYLQSALVIACALGISHFSFAAEQPRNGGTLTWGIETEPNTFNPQLNGQSKAELILRVAWESLLARKADGDYVPWLAESYQVSDDGKTFSFKLRKDVSFSNGEKFNAQAVAQNFLHTQDAAYCAGSSLCAMGARIASVETPDDFTLVIRLKQTYTPFLSFAASLKQLSPASWRSTQLKAGGKEIAGTGPFILESYEKGQQVTFVKNPHYNWAPAVTKHQGPAYLDKVIYRFLPESSVRSGALLSGQVDVIEGISGNDATEFKDNDDFTYQHALNTGTPYSLFLNVDYGPTRELHVRQALLQGLDIDPILKSVYRGERTRAWGITSPVDPLYDKGLEQKYGNQPDKANQLLDEAGWTVRDSAGFRTKAGKRLSVEIIQAQATVRDQRDVLLQAIQAQARQRLGVELNIRYVDSGTYAEVRKSGQFGSIANSNTETDGIDIENHYRPVNAGGSINYSRVNSPQIQYWLDEASRTLDTAKRRSLYGQLQQYALPEQAVAVPLYEPEDQIAAASYVHGVGFRSYKQMPENAYDVWLSDH
ncbi:peptide/nickel transport system substrate-binding protein [Erwinia toletana]|uniref:Peptide/nickel transport system substrate-binding protein n=1 Tax=Winslowiella toletana TaxID=92490 RepID=A0ABS4P445_9GAMM|nr:ABC transporter substrate-binding protein [Winslowiella toletana]MBP2167406.1 peptide/nickel transport system substrate-binding protein [Winslowiella toletana]